MSATATAGDAVIREGDAIIRVGDVRKSYGDVRAVDGVTFSVSSGQIFGLLGPNGAGKTTTVEMLEGLRQPDSGSLEVLGIDVARHPDALKERIGVALQTAELYPKLTVVEVLDLFRSFYRRSVPTAQLLEFLDLGERRSAQTRHLSGGQRQRLAVALALVNDPEVVFLDEPTTGLDPAARRALWSLVERLKEQGKTVLDPLHGGSRGVVRPGGDHGPRTNPRHGRRRGSGEPAVPGEGGPVRSHSRTGR
jgi:ABC-2 type transport system ATP-binding protein